MTLPVEITPDTESEELRSYLDRMFLKVSVELDITFEPQYGGIRMDTPTDIPPLDSTWYTLAVFDAEVLEHPAGVIQDFANDQLILLTAGTYMFNVIMSLTHDEVNEGRELKIRLRNPTNDSVTPPFVVGTGRNVGVTSITMSGTMFEVPASGVDKTIQVQIGNGSDYAGVSVAGVVFTANKISSRSL